MNQKELIRKGKFIAMVLRHSPEKIGLEFDQKGRIKIEDLLKAMNAHGVEINRELLNVIVETNNKKRFVIDGDYIYAAQGHSKPVNVEMDESTPPDTLYHGTAVQSVDSIYSKGINSGNRNHVHLSQDIETATNVGSRHGKPVILYIDTKSMHEAGQKFYLSKNNVWLTDFIDPKYIKSI